ncbi:MAG: ADP-ribosylation/Crystallin J1 [Mesotoga infera]|uniref:ADP-ribosylation/Crystallin J1 n=1 Tax=Mesotoga infera TaxID=1236046 RepID=A0A101GWU4_9BACT|nr:MAG: ADP-ribosylation/Crystallin J1 [Mesotoga infera]
MNRIFRALEAFAVGDAMGMVTEFMTRRQISSRFRFVSDLLEPNQSLIHRNLVRGQITDDTNESACSSLMQPQQK